MRRHKVLVDLPQLLHTEIDVLLCASQLLREFVDGQHLPLHAQEALLEAQKRLLHLPHLQLNTQCIRANKHHFPSQGQLKRT